MSEELISGADEYTEYENSIKNKNRFIIEPRFNEYFDSIIEQCFSTIEEDTILFRSRGNKPNIRTPFEGEDIGMPKVNTMIAGRANPLGIQYLYLSEDVNTSIAELRKNVHDYISVGEFKVIDDLRVVHLSNFVITNSYIKDGYEPFTLSSFILNLSHAFSKPIQQKELEYLPCQYFCEYCKNKNIDGVKYLSSAVGKNSWGDEPKYNIVLFTDEKVRWIRSRVYVIDEITYEISDVKSQS